MSTQSKAKDILGHLEKNLAVKNKNVFGSRGQKGVQVILEDINMPLADMHLPMREHTLDNISALELIRGLQQNPKIWDEEKLLEKQYEDL